MALTDQDRERIRAEEIYRAEVRRSLPNEKAPLFSRLLAFFSTPVILWLLTVVIAGGLVRYWNDRQAERAREYREYSKYVDNELRTAHLGAEIHMRLLDLATAVYADRTATRLTRSTRSARLYRDVLTYLDESPATEPALIHNTYLAYNRLTLMQLAVRWGSENLFDVSSVTGLQQLERLTQNFKKAAGKKPLSDYEAAAVAIIKTFPDDWKETVLFEFRHDYHPLE